MRAGWWHRAWHALSASHGDANPPTPEIELPTWPDAPLEEQQRAALARAVRRARWYKAAAHLIQQQSDIAADEARRNDPERTAECSFWRYAYERRTTEADALRSALKAILAVVPETGD